MDLQVLGQLESHIAADVVMPQSAEYETLRRVLNRRGSPAVIVRPQSAEDIVTALSFARDQRFAVSVRSGGHLLIGQATNDGGVVIALARFNATTSRSRVRLRQNVISLPFAFAHAAIESKVTAPLRCHHM
jgi:FAD/FMN-containing dehydrogenase